MTLERIGGLYDIEAKIRSRTADERRAVRQGQGRPKVEAFIALAEEKLEHISGKQGTWLGGMLTRKPLMFVRVALANRMARIVWAFMARGGVYKAPARAA